MAALERQLAEGGRWGRQFALLLVEVDGAERLRLAGQAGKRTRTRWPGSGERSASALRRVDLLAHEEDARLWVIAPGCGPRGRRWRWPRGWPRAIARTAGSRRRAADARRSACPCIPEDGRDAGALTEHAEEQMFAARAAGVAVAGLEPAHR